MCVWPQNSNSEGHYLSLCTHCARLYLGLGVYSHLRPDMILLVCELAHIHMHTQTHTHTKKNVCGCTDIFVHAINMYTHIEAHICIHMYLSISTYLLYFKDICR